MNAFDVKEPHLLTDPLRGYDALHDEAKEMLGFLCELAAAEGMPRLIVTCFGRLRDDQEQIYFPMERQRVNQTAVGKAADELARKLARARFSWHCIDKGDGKSRAIDLRDWILTAEQRGILVDRARLKFPLAEILDHAVPGGARHLHFAAPAPSRPKEWW